MLFSLLLAGNLVLLPAAIVKTVTVLAWNHPAPSNSKLVYAIAHYAVVRGMHYVLMYVTSKVLCIMVNFWPDLQFINNENCHTQHEQAFQKRRWPYQSAFWQSGEQYTTRRQRLQRRRAPEAPQLAQLYSSSSSGAQVRLAASAFPPPPLARDAVWGSVHRCCCSEPAIPAHTQTLIHKPGPCTYTNAKGSYESVRKNGRSCSLFCHTWLAARLMREMGNEVMVRCQPSGRDNRTDGQAGRLCWFNTTEIFAKPSHVSHA